MGRLTEYFDFINTKEIRTEEERDFLYSHLTITDKIKKLRRKNLKKIKKRSVVGFYSFILPLVPPLSVHYLLKLELYVKT